MYIEKENRETLKMRIYFCGIQKVEGKKEKEFGLLQSRYRPNSFYIYLYICSSHRHTQLYFISTINLGYTFYWKKPHSSDSLSFSSR